MKKAGIAVFLAVAVVALSAQTSHAVAPFRNAFEEVYLKDNKDSQFVEAVKEAKCNVCHYGKSKKNRNDYGKALAELLDKKDYTTSRIKAEPDKVQKELEAAFRKVEQIKSSQGMTFGELIKAGKLPGTAPEAAEANEEGAEAE